MSMAVDKTKTWRKVEDRLAAETSPRKRALLENVLAHMKAEAVPDLEGLMVTLSAQPDYHFWGPTGDTGPKGTDAVRSFYTAFANSGAHRLEYDVQRIVVDDDCVVLEGVMRIIYPGATLAAMGRPVDDPNGWYLYEDRMVTFWPYDADGLLVGEDSYTVGVGFENMRKLAVDEIPDL
jgi:SnoaL-like domain